MKPYVLRQKLLRSAPTHICTAWRKLSCLPAFCLPKWTSPVGSRQETPITLQLQSSDHIAWDGQMTSGPTSSSGKELILDTQSSPVCPPVMGPVLINSDSPLQCTCKSNLNEVTLVCSAWPCCHRMENSHTWHMALPGTCLLHGWRDKGGGMHGGWTDD